jgi:hypothetical protein
MTNIAMKRKNRNFAMSAAAPAMPPKPRIAATIAMTMNIAAHFSMFFPPFIAGPLPLSAGPLTKSIDTFQTQRRSFCEAACVGLPGCFYALEEALSAVVGQPRQSSSVGVTVGNAWLLIWRPKLFLLLLGEAAD